MRKKRSQENPAKTVGRPTVFSEELADRICSLIEEGWSLVRVCGLEGMPSRRTVFLWLDNPKHEAFLHKYRCARDRCLEFHADTILDVRTDPNLYLHRDDFGRLDTTPTQIAKLYSDNVKWTLARLMPKKYGDKTQHELTGADGQPLSVSVTIGSKPAKS